MHTLTISIQDAASDSMSVELPDDQALPVYVKLKEVVDALRPLGAVQVLEKSSRAEPLLQAIEEVVTLNDAMQGM